MMRSSKAHCYPLAADSVNIAHLLVLYLASTIRTEPIRSISFVITTVPPWSGTVWPPTVSPNTSSWFLFIYLVHDEILYNCQHDPSCTSSLTCCIAYVLLLRIVVTLTLFSNVLSNLRFRRGTVGRQIPLVRQSQQPAFSDLQLLDWTFDPMPFEEVHHILYFCCCSSWQTLFLRPLTARIHAAVVMPSATQSNQ